MPARRVYIATALFAEEEIADPAIREHNRRVVGNTPILPAKPVRALPGVIHALDAPYAYAPVFFGARREWLTDEEGWETVNYRRKGRKARRWREVRNPVRT